MYTLLIKCCWQINQRHSTVDVILQWLHSLDSSRTELSVVLTIVYRKIESSACASWCAFVRLKKSNYLSIWMLAHLDPTLCLVIKYVDVRQATWCNKRAQYLLGITTNCLLSRCLLDVYHLAAITSCACVYTPRGYGRLMFHLSHYGQTVLSMVHIV